MPDHSTSEGNQDSSPQTNWALSYFDAFVVSTHSAHTREVGTSVPLTYKVPTWKGTNKMRSFTDLLGRWGGTA